MKKKGFVYKRIVLKLSGEALQGEEQYGINAETIQSIARQIKEIHNSGLEVVIVIGGGNIFRGIQTADQEGIDRSTADYMGMLATVINGLALQDVLERIGVVTRVQGAIEMKELIEPYIRRRAIRHLEKNRIVIMVGGTGNPYFTTDTAAALRAIELNADGFGIETKTLKLYLETFRDKQEFCEDLTVNICNTMFHLTSPHSCSVELVQRRRGGIQITAKHYIERTGL